ncbi:DNA uptake/competence protein ComA [Legionella lansingensis]|uniref:DNA uptake/competence protein ComA n=1 Tax=Legionella lansingensis TaxID=45067 RepID=A0A0W0VZX4_9GAMM|nr:DNA internalization-related competence protein ComEC/Rec2 [Legionella lansingensis]KTD25454.1 DNA uptake/competence protein ComA [Legionella lansingensis]SNV51479.1 DNA uptake/competence protein ComA [Legionella lansingensis]
MEILCFFAGTVFAHTKSLYSLFFLVLTLILHPRWVMASWFMAAIVWSFAHQWWLADQGMPSKDMQVIPKGVLEGKIISIPTNSAAKSQFQFLINRLDGKKAKAIVLLACYNRCPRFKMDDVWRFQAKLKKPKNLGNPGSFDYVSWLHARHINWTGYIQPRTARLLSRASSSKTLLGLREHLASALDNMIPSQPVRGVFEALTLGLTSHLNKTDWDLFRRTGTTHLMVISGAHIGLVAGLCFSLMRWLWSRSSMLCLRYPAIQAASVAGLVMALMYALLAGFGAPAQRSLVACFFLLLKNFLGYRFTAWQAWRYSLFAVLLFEPHDVLLPGFYLSFLAVASLLLVSQRVSCTGYRKTFYLQLGCLFGLMPLTLFWFSYGAVNGLVANLLAIPLVGFVIVPLSLVSLCLVQFWPSHILLIPVDGAIQLLLHYLQFIDSFSLLNLQFSFSNILPALSLMFAMLLILFFPVRAIYPACIALVFASLFPGYPKIKVGEVEINVLDVGQGLAVVVRTARHALVYDTGVKFYQGGDMAKLAILPFLETVGIKKLDKIIISHPDLDHRGGLTSLEEKYKSSELVVNDVAFYHRGKNCHHYPAWEWEGISFRFLAIKKKFRNKNNSSCILKLEGKGGAVLLTGDIEKQAENYLLRVYGETLNASLLVVPHHGSKTSSSVDFVKGVAPKFAVISAGFDNRYHFPHQQTLDTLRQQHIEMFNTMDCGMVTMKLTNGKLNSKPTCYASNTK